MVTTKITVSKREFVFACLWACRHGYQEVSVYADPEGFVFLEPYLTQFGANCVNLGAADVSNYCDDVESEEATEQVLDRMDLNSDWSLATYRENPRSPMQDVVSINWVD